jgi:acyl phosphate:glycerol-3-phosphate acyltransferase
MSAATPILAVLAAYLLGSVPFGIVLTRLLTGKDVRAVGSGNIGASNVTRAAGKTAGVLTLLLDAVKASVPMMLAMRYLGQDRASAEWWAVLVGLAAFFGHLFPIWLKFKGGKGVATALGVFAVLAPIPVLLAVVLFSVAFAVTRVPAVGSLVGTLVVCAGTWVQVFRARGAEAWSSPVPWAALLVTVIIVFRHRGNIDRLRKGGEHRV